MEEPTDNLLVQTSPQVMLPEGQTSPAALSITQSDSGPAQPAPAFLLSARWGG